MAGLRLQLSRAEDVARFREYARQVAATRDINNPQMRQHLQEQAQAWNVHSVDAERVLQELVGSSKALPVPKAPVPEALPPSQNAPLPKAQNSNSLATAAKTQETVPPPPPTTHVTTPAQSALPANRQVEIQIVVTNSLPPTESENGMPTGNILNVDHPVSVENPPDASEEFLDNALALCIAVVITLILVVGVGLIGWVIINVFAPKLLTS